jgi:hypothetical protein
MASASAVDKIPFFCDESHLGGLKSGYGRRGYVNIVWQWCALYRDRNFNFSSLHRSMGADGSKQS